jgi:hypothetical protein
MKDVYTGGDGEDTPSHCNLQIDLGADPICSNRGQSCPPLGKLHVGPSSHEANAALQDLAYDLDLLFVSRSVDQNISVGDVEFFELE